MISIQSEHLKLVVDPQGATIVEFSSQGIPVLQKAPIVYTPDECGGFPLLPMANRVKDNCYQWMDEKVQLDRNSADGSEYLHGQGWQSLWHVLTTPQEQPNTIELGLNFAHPHNGYHYQAKVKFQLCSNANSLKISMQIAHLAANSRLYGLGFHPYFYIEPEQDQLLINAVGYCPEIEHHFAGAPTANIPAPFNYGTFQPISDQFVNHCYLGFNGLQLKRQALENPSHPQGIVELTSNMPYLMMYHVPRAKFIALEPQSHAIDGCHHADLGGLKALSQPFNQLEHSLTIALK